MSGALRAKAPQVLWTGHARQAWDASCRPGCIAGAWLRDLAAQLSACGSHLQDANGPFSNQAGRGSSGPASAACGSALFAAPSAGSACAMATMAAFAQGRQRHASPAQAARAAASNTASMSSAPGCGGIVRRYSTDGIDSAATTRGAADAAPLVEHGPARRCRVIAAAISGGVDSAMAASMMQQTGHEVSEI